MGSQVANFSQRGRGRLVARCAGSGTTTRVLPRLLRLRPQERRGGPEPRPRETGRPLGGWRDERLLEDYRALRSLSHEQQWDLARSAGWPGTRQDYFREKGWPDTPGSSELPADTAAGAGSVAAGGDGGDPGLGRLVAADACVMDARMLVALPHAGDPYHSLACTLVADLREQSVHVVLPTFCMVEADMLLRSAGVCGPSCSPSAFLMRYLKDDEFVRMKDVLLLRVWELVNEPRDLPLGTAAAAAVAEAERLGTPLLATLDHRHMQAVRPRHVGAFELLP